MKQIHGIWCSVKRVIFPCRWKPVNTHVNQFHQSPLQNVPRNLFVFFTSCHIKALSSCSRVVLLSDKINVALRGETKVKFTTATRCDEDKVCIFSPPLPPKTSQIVFVKSLLKLNWNASVKNNSKIVSWKIPGNNLFIFISNCKIDCFYLFSNDPLPAVKAFM